MAAGGGELEGRERDWDGDRTGDFEVVCEGIKFTIWVGRDQVEQGLAWV